MTKSGLVVLALLAAHSPASMAQSMPITFAQEFDSPIVLNDAQVLSSGQAQKNDVVLTISNESHRAIGFLEFILAPAECPSATTSRSLHIKFQATESPLGPESQLQLTVRGALIRRVVRSQSHGGCRDQNAPELALATVGFCDGTAWYAGGPGYSEWHGRPWSHGYGDACGKPKQAAVAVQ